MGRADGGRQADFVQISQKATADLFLRRLLNLNSHNHNQRDRRRRFYLAVLIERASVQSQATPALFLDPSHSSRCLLRAPIDAQISPLPCIGFASPGVGRAQFELITLVAPFAG